MGFKEDLTTALGASGSASPAVPPAGGEVDALRAELARLGRRKGYSLVGGNSAGNNAFFVRDDVRGSIPAVTPEAAYRRAQFREARDANGALTFDDFSGRVRTVENLVLHDLESDREVAISSLGLR